MNKGIIILAFVAVVASAKDGVLGITWGTGTASAVMQLKNEGFTVQSLGTMDGANVWQIITPFQGLEAAYRLRFWNGKFYAYQIIIPYEESQFHEIYTKFEDGLTKKYGEPQTGDNHKFWFYRIGTPAAVNISLSLETLTEPELMTLVVLEYSHHATVQEKVRTEEARNNEDF